MHNGYTIVRVEDGEFVTEPLPDNGSLSEERALSFAWTLSRDMPGTEIGVVECGVLIESFLVGDKGWMPVVRFYGEDLVL